MREDEAKSIIEAMRAEKAAKRRRRTWGKSKLLKHRPVIVAMHRAGASLAEIAQQLETKHRCDVARSTVQRFLQKLPEVRDVSAA